MSMNLARRFGTLFSHAIGVVFLALASAAGAVAAEMQTLCYTSLETALIPLARNDTLRKQPAAVKSVLRALRRASVANTVDVARLGVYWQATNQPSPER
jgi:hypothetical protein